MYFKKEYEDDVVILVPGAHLVGDEKTKELEGELFALLEGNQTKIMIDLHRVRVMNTLAFTMFLRVYEQLQQSDTQWAFCRVPDKHLHPMIVLKLVRHFNVCETREEALRFLNRGTVEA